MIFFKKSLKVFFLAASFFSAGLFAQEAAEISTDYLLNEDDWDSVFENSSDLEEGVTREKEQTGLNKALNNFFIPLSFSGHLEGQAGIADEILSGEQTVSGLLNMTNYLYMTARVDKTLGFRGTIYTAVPNFGLSVYELYFDYLAFDRVYFTGGKKSTTWGYVRLFSDSDDYITKDVMHQNEEVLLTNILYDSLNSISAQIRVPVWTGTISALAMAPMGSSVSGGISYKEFSYAASVEMTVLHTSLNLFARKNPTTDDPNAYKKPILGFEAKRTILGADVYGQGILNVSNWKKIYSKEGVAKVVLTAGVYKWWDAKYPNVGFNVEFQDVYVTPTDAHKMRVAFDGGIKQLIFGRSCKFGFAMRHTLRDDETGKKNYGTAHLAFTVSGLLPHADWETGFQLNYGENPAWTFKSPRWHIGSVIKLTLDY